MLKKSTFKGRITLDNVISYLATTYSDNDRKAVTIQSNKVLSYDLLLQADYGKAQDCSLTSITSVVNYETMGKFNVANIYKMVETTSSHYFYNSDKWGTIPVFIKAVLNKTLESVNAKHKKSKSAYFKGVGVKWETFTSQINKSNPVILNLWNDGRDFYTNHTVTVIGYATYEAGNHTARLLAVADNWNDSVSFIDFDVLNPITSVNYISK